MKTLPKKPVECVAVSFIHAVQYIIQYKSSKLQYGSLANTTKIVFMRHISFTFWSETFESELDDNFF